MELREVTQEVIEDYRNRLNAHIEAVQEAGEIVGVHYEQLAKHDLSKWDREEFGPYAAHFCGGGAPDLFAPAWLHHIHHNPHHWQHWIFPDGYSLEGANIEPGGVMKMPEHYALEMIADWMGASKAYTGSFDMTDWLYKNMPKILVHSETARFLADKLWNLGFEDVIRVQRWAHEIKD